MSDGWASVVRIGALLTHPVQYVAPLFRKIANTPGIDLHVYYAHAPTPEEQGEGFGVPFAWDVDLFGGYEHTVLKNVSKTPGRGFLGYDTPSVAEVLGQRHFDAFLVFGWHALSYWQALRACWKLDIPVLVRGDSQLSADGNLVKRVAKRIAYPRFMRKFAVCLSVGTRSEEYFRYYGARRVVCAPHFVDNDYFAQRSGDRSPSAAVGRARWSIPPDAILCIFSGKLVSAKRPLDLVSALGHAGAPNLWAVFVGDGELRERCEREARASGVRARFVGFLNQTEMPMAYAASDFLVLPSARETWGLVVNEAMACGLPAIVSRDVGCYPDLITEGVTGHGFSPGNVDELARHLRDLANDPKRACAMGQRARERVQSFSVDAAAAAIIGAVCEARAGISALAPARTAQNVAGGRFVRD